MHVRSLFILQLIMKRFHSAVQCGTQTGDFMDVAIL